MRVCLLSGGGGGARFARGLQDALEPGSLTVVANVGDDVEVLGLHISPDLDSVLYALADLIDSDRGWGRAGETWHALESASAWGGEDWFRLGDLDLGIHLVRTQALRAGEPLSVITERLVRRVGVSTRILPATDDTVSTVVVTPAGSFAFQEWYVGRRHLDEVDAVRFEGADAATPAAGVVEAIAGADVVVLAPSNPYLSIGPILAVPGIRDALQRRRAPRIAVSPLIAGKAVTGPLDRMLSRMAGGTSPRTVSERYEGLIDALVIDESDAPGDSGVRTIVTRTLMGDRDGARRLAEAVLEAAL